MQSRIRPFPLPPPNRCSPKRACNRAGVIRGAGSTPLRRSGSPPDHSGVMRTRTGSIAVLALVAGAALVVAACSGQSVTGSAHILTPGTWGGENAGAIVDDTLVAVHIGCTLGNFTLAAAVADQGRVRR